MSEKRMVLTVLEIQRQKWTGGILLPAASGIRVKHCLHIAVAIAQIDAMFNSR